MKIIDYIKNKFINNKMLLKEYSDTIDPSIRSLVEYCDEKNLKPIASCSGVKSEHKERNSSGQLAMMDSKTARKIAAYFIDSDKVFVSISSKPKYEKYLYGNYINDCVINLNFKNYENELLPEIEKAIMEIVNKEISVDENKLSYVNKIVNFFNKMKSPMDIYYNFNDQNKILQDSLEFSTVMFKKCVDVDNLVKVIAEEYNLEYMNSSKDKLLDINEIYIPSSSRNELIPKLFKTCKKREKKAKIIENSYIEPDYDYYDDYDEYSDDRDFEKDLQNQINDINESLDVNLKEKVEKNSIGDNIR